MSDEERRACQECGKEPATVHLTEFIDGKPVKIGLCEECYGKKEGLLPLPQSKIFAQIINAIAPDLQKMGAKACPECGITYLEFRRALRLGCPKDYEAFGEALDDLLERIHGANRHVGKIPVGLAQNKIPVGLAQKQTRELRLQALRRELEQVVGAEDYERAAQLRDLIRGLEQDNAGSDEQ